MMIAGGRRGMSSKNGCEERIEDGTEEVCRVRRLCRRLSG